MENEVGARFLVELKNGTLEETEDGLIAHDADRSKSVVYQVQRALDNVREKFRRTQGAIEFDYLMYCPAHRLVGINAVALDASRVVDATQRDQFPERITSAWGWGIPGGLGRDGPGLLPSDPQARSVTSSGSHGITAETNAASRPSTS